jgi:hypothetical protein
MSNPPIVYTPHPDATPEGELNALANVYRFVLDCHHAKKEATRPGGPDARKENLHDSGNTSIRRAS